MKKKKLTKKITIDKVTIATLNFDVMSIIKGGSILAPCSASCSILELCCDPLSRTNCDPVEKVAKG